MDDARKAPPKNQGSPQVVTTLQTRDVLMGRGAVQTEYEGNIRLRELVIEHRDAYARSNKHKEKQQIVWAIVGTVQAQGGRFLRRVEQPASLQNQQQLWEVIVDRRVIVDKVKQLLRDLDPGTQLKRKMRKRKSKPFEPEKDFLKSHSADQASPQRKQAPTERNNRSHRLEESPGVLPWTEGSHTSNPKGAFQMRSLYSTKSASQRQREIPGHHRDMGGTSIEDEKLTSHFSSVCSSARTGRAVTRPTSETDFTTSRNQRSFDNSMDTSRSVSGSFVGNLIAAPTGTSFLSPTQPPSLLNPSPPNQDDKSSSSMKLPKKDPENNNLLALAYLADLYQTPDDPPTNHDDKDNDGNPRNVRKD